MTQESTGFGESQIAIEMLATASRNYENEVGRYGKGSNQVIYALRIISHFVTFYCGEYTTEYLDELEDGSPLSLSATIRRFPGLNTSTSGLNLIDVVQRRTALTGLQVLQRIFAQK